MRYEQPFHPPELPLLLLEPGVVGRGLEDAVVAHVGHGDVLAAVGDAVDRSAPVERGGRGGVWIGVEVMVESGDIVAGGQGREGEQEE